VGVPNIVKRLVEEAENEVIRRRIEPFRLTADGNHCTPESIRILLEAESQGYVLGVEKDHTFTVTKDGTSYLRSNDDILRFGRFTKIAPRLSKATYAYAVSFREPMNFPEGTTLYVTGGPRVALLPDLSLIVDEDGLVGGRTFETADEYRAKTGDREAWVLIKRF
jgi:hypothetical protein